MNCTQLLFRLNKGCIMKVIQIDLCKIIINITHNQLDSCTFGNSHTSQNLNDEEK